MPSNKIKLFSVLLMISFVMLTGCFPTGEVVIPDGGSSGMGELLAMVDEIENLTLDLTLPENYPEEVPQVTIKLRKWDNDELLRIFLDGKTITEQAEYTSYLPDEKRYYYETDEGYSLSFESGNIYFDHNEKMNENGYRKFLSALDTYHCENMLMDSLDGFTVSDATDRVNAMLDKVGISNYGEPFVYPISAEKANLWFEREAHEQKEIWGEETQTRVWGKEDEIYILKYPLKYGNIPLEMDLLPVKDEYLTNIGPDIRAVVTKDDILLLECNAIYSAEYEIVESVPINWSAANTMNRIIGEYSNTMITSPITFYNCYLVYAPTDKNGDGGVILTPAWHIDYAKHTEITADMGGMKYSEYRDAQTGNKLVSQ